MATRKQETPGFTPETRLSTLARSTWLEELGGVELVVYLRLIDAAVDGVARARNADLYRRDPRGAARALRRLADRGLIRVRNGEVYKHLGRSIEVV